MLTRLKAPVDHDPSKVCCNFAYNIKIDMNLKPSIKLLGIRLLK